MEEDNDMSDLEKVARKGIDMIECDVKKCELRGDYWKCYMGNFTGCTIYRNSKYYKDKFAK